MATCFTHPRIKPAIRTGSRSNAEEEAGRKAGATQCLSSMFTRYQSFTVSGRHLEMGSKTKNCPYLFDMGASTSSGKLSRPNAKAQYIFWGSFLVSALIRCRLEPYSLTLRSFSDSRSSKS